MTSMSANYEEGVGVVTQDCGSTTALRGHISDKCPFSSAAISILEVVG